MSNKKPVPTTRTSPQASSRLKEEAHVVLSKGQKKSLLSDVAKARAIAADLQVSRSTALQTARDEERLHCHGFADVVHGIPNALRNFPEGDLGEFVDDESLKAIASHLASIERSHASIVRLAAAGMRFADERELQWPDQQDVTLRVDPNEFASVEVGLQMN